MDKNFLFNKPDEILRLRDSMYVSNLFITAVHHLDFFNYIASNPSTLPRIEHNLQIKRRPTDVMLTYFVSKGFLKEKNGKYELTNLSRTYLTKNSPYDISSYYLPFKNTNLCIEMLDVLKTDKPANWAGEKDTNDWHKDMETAEFSKVFIDSMDKRGRSIAPVVADALKNGKYNSILDIGGGSGIYSVSIIKKIKGATATIIEKPPVDNLVKDYIAKQKLTKRIAVLGMDFFEQDLPEGYDTHLFSNVIHDWGEDKVRELFKKSYNTLNSGGHIIIHDAHLNDNKSGPVEVAELSVLLMFMTQGKCYSKKEITDLLKETGFKKVSYIDLKFAYRSLIIAKKD